MNRKHLIKISSLVATIMLTVIFSCKDKEEPAITTSDTEDLSEETIVDGYFQDMDDMAGVVVAAPSEEDYEGGRKKTTITIEDPRFKCNGIVITLNVDPNSTIAEPKGSLVVDFGTGCTDLRGNIRAGKVIFTYSGRRFITGSSIVTTTDNYSINGVKLEGSRTITMLESQGLARLKYRAVLLNGKATFPDGRIAERGANLVIEWVRAVIPANDELIIDKTSVANGKSRGGRDYTLSLLENLHYKRYCGIAVEGVKKYVIDGSREITIDYGNGDCDREITVSANGMTRTITI